MKFDVKSAKEEQLEVKNEGNAVELLPIGEKEIREAASILAKYKAAKSNLESRIVEDERWYQIRHWEVLRRKEAKDPKDQTPEPTSAWLFNTIANKHADAMDNFPEPNVLPRERDDEQDAKTLASVLPVIWEMNEFEQTYSDAWWCKLKHGFSVYGTFWNSSKENGLGDIDVQQIDPLNLFWEPGITSIQRSRNLFIVSLIDNDLLKAQYPQYQDKFKGSVINVTEYIHDDTIDNSDKSLVVDWYYKRIVGSRTVLHYCKFCNDVLLFASENEDMYREVGWYEHGQYPIVLDVLYPEAGTPIGFGLIAIAKDPQLYIDKLGGNILNHSLIASNVRYFAKENSGINEDEFLDIRKPIVHVSGDLSEERLRQIEVKPLSSLYFQVMLSKVDELKETSGNRDVNSGGTGSGVTAAAAIAALQEAGNKLSRDNISTGYRAATKIAYLTIELIRQFYDETRCFRITGQGGSYEYINLNNEKLKGTGFLGLEPVSNRKPIFDIKIKPQKRNPFSRMAQNETAKELYGLGFFDPQRADQALIALDMMDFEGKERVREQVQQGQTLLKMVMQLQMELQKAMLLVQYYSGKNILGAEAAGFEETEPKQGNAGSSGLSRQATLAQKPQLGYAERLAQRSTPNLDSQRGLVQ